MDIKIYNLFPRLYHGIEEWLPAAKKAKEMGFNMLYINSFLQTGESNSIYAIRNYKQFDRQCFPNGSWEDNIFRLEAFLSQCREIGLLVIFDLVINHTSTDSDLIATHENWYQYDEEGEVRRATTYTADGRLVIWEDCAKFDYTQKDSGLWQYVESICRFYLKLGFSGFRCDVATHVPDYFWKYLIQSLRRDYPKVLFLGESFLALPEQIAGLAEAGFDYIFNSAKWWDYRSAWFVEQNERNRETIPSIAFPDNHDTGRLMQDTDGNIPEYLQRLFFTAIISGGFMMTNGFEYGFRKKLDVHTTTSADWEDTGLDFTDAVKDALQLRERYPVFRQEGHLEILPAAHSELLALLKMVLGQTAVLFLNRSNHAISLAKKEVEQIAGLGETELWEGLELKPYDFRYYVTGDSEQEVPMPENESLFLISPQRLRRQSCQLSSLQQGEALVQICSCGICGSDYLEYRQGPFYWRPSCTGGHEFSGIICALEPPCGELSTGDKVVYRIPREGTGIVQGGGYSRYAVVRTDCLFRLEAGEDMNIAAMIEPLAAAVHAGKNVQGTEQAAIAGSGTIALLLERYLRLKYPRLQVTLFYKHQNICNYTDSGTHCIDIRSDAAECHGEEKYDVVFECSGDAKNVRWLSEKMKRNGRMILAGIYGEEVGFNPSGLMFGEKSIQGSFLYTEQDFAEAADLICNKRIFVEDMMQIMPFEQYRNAFEMPSEQRIKVILSRETAE